MMDPVMDMDGHNYERLAITNWIQKGQDNIGLGICPISHKPLCKRDLIPNTSLKEQIHRWCRKHGFPIPSPPPEPVREGEDESHNNSPHGAITILEGNDSDHHCDVSGIPELRNNNQSDYFDSMELGAAIQSLSSVISAKEDYVVEFDDEISTIASSSHLADSHGNNHDNDVQEEEEVVATPSPADEDDEMVQVGLDGSRDLSQSLLLNMFLPQEREAMMEQNRRARQRRRDAQRRMWLAHVRFGMIMSAIVIATVVLIFVLAKFILHLKNNNRRLHNKLLSGNLWKDGQVSVPRNSFSTTATPSAVDPYAIKIAYY